MIVPASRLPLLLAAVAGAGLGVGVTAFGQARDWGGLEFGLAVAVLAGIAAWKSYDQVIERVAAFLRPEQRPPL